ncbi:MAG: thiamine ABC transporter substrate binding subunit [Gammaproteobacteria bacterium]
MRIVVAAILSLWAGLVLAAGKPVLTVYTYNSFTAEWGPGPGVKKAFEADCGCELNYVALDDGVALLSRVRLEGANAKGDVVLGLDTNLTAEAAATGLFAPHGLELGKLALPAPWVDSVFVPFDYGYFAFVYDKTKLAQPPASLDDLINGPAEQKIIIEDPRVSTPGLGLLLWLRQVYGDGSKTAWEKLRPRILTVTKGWSEAYGLFLKGEAPLVLSYTTSPAYHLIAENKDNYAAADFKEGHYLQIEVAGMLKSSAQPELAKRFLAFVVTQAFQEQIPTTNWMYPVIALPNGLPKGFETLVQPSKALAYAPAEVAANRKRWIEEWLEALGR